MARDPADILAEAEERARLARSLLEHPALLRAYSTLVARYVEQWRSSPLGLEGQAERDVAYSQLKALDGLLEEIKGAVTGGDVARHNLGAARPNGRI